MFDIHTHMHIYKHTKDSNVYSKKKLGTQNKILFVHL